MRAGHTNVTMLVSVDPSTHLTDDLIHQASIEMYVLKGKHARNVRIVYYCGNDFYFFTLAIIPKT